MIKSIFFLLLFGSGMAYGFSPTDTIKIWIDYKGEPIAKENAYQYRLTWPEDSVWRVLDYNLDGSLQMSGGYETEALKKKTGPFTYYTKNGVLQIKCHYLEGQYVGSYEEWFDNGQIEFQGTYSDDFNRFQVELNDKTNEGRKVTKIYHSDSLSIKTGRWEYFHPNGQASAIEEYDENGNRRSVVYFEPDGSDSPEDVVVECMPEFPGGEVELMRYLGRNIKYPKKDKRKMVTGDAMVSFQIDREGKIKDPKIIQSVSPLIDAECLRVVNGMPDWKPGRAFNHEVNVDYRLPIRFTLR
jgi:TonB family protein